MMVFAIYLRLQIWPPFGLPMSNFRRVYTNTNPSKVNQLHPKALQERGAVLHNRSLMASGASQPFKGTRLHAGNSTARPLKIANPKRKRSSSNHQFSGAIYYIKFRGIVTSPHWKGKIIFQNLSARGAIFLPMEVVLLTMYWISQKLSAAWTCPGQNLPEKCTLLLMEEIPDNHLRCKKILINTGVNYPPQLVIAGFLNHQP